MQVDVELKMKTKTIWFVEKFILTVYLSHILLKLYISFKTNKNRINLNSALNIAEHITSNLNRESWGGRGREIHIQNQ